MLCNYDTPAGGKHSTRCNHIWFESLIEAQVHLNFSIRESSESSGECDVDWMSPCSMHRKLIVACHIGRKKIDEKKGTSWRLSMCSLIFHSLTSPVWIHCQHRCTLALVATPYSVHNTHTPKSYLGGNMHFFQLETILDGTKIKSGQSGKNREYFAFHGFFSSFVSSSSQLQYGGPRTVTSNRGEYRTLNKLNPEEQTKRKPFVKSVEKIRKKMI